MIKVSGKRQAVIKKRVSSLFAVGFILPLGLLANFALNAQLARILTIDEFGVFSFSHSIATILALLCCMGTSVSMVRFVAAYRVSEKLGHLKGLLIFSSLAVFVLGIITSAVVWLIALHSSGHHMGLMATSLMILPMSIDVWRESSMRGLKLNATAIAPRQFVLPIYVFIIIHFYHVQGLVQAYYVYIGSLAVVVVLSLFSFLSRVRGIARIPPIYEKWRWTKASIPMGGGALLLLGLNRWDVVALGFLSQYAEAGMYSACAKVAILLSVASRIVNLMIAPLLAEMYHEGQMPEFRLLLVRSMLLLTSIGIPLYLGICWFSNDILSIFGREYVAGKPILVILAAGQLANLISGPCAFALTMSKHERVNFNVSLLSAALSVVMLITLIPRFGAVGAAVHGADRISSLQRKAAAGPNAENLGAVVGERRQ